MLAWAFIPNFSCDETAEVCLREDNWGWRYLVLSLGAITFAMFLCRFFLFTFYESPKFLVSRGRQEEAVAAVQGIARQNRTTTWLTVELLNEIGGIPEETQSEKLSALEIIKRSLSRFSLEQIAPLFGSKRLGLSSKSLSNKVRLAQLKLMTRSHSNLVLLDLHWTGLHPLQRFPAPIYRPELHCLRDLPQLCYHRRLWHPWTPPCLGYG